MYTIYFFEQINLNCITKIINCKYHTKDPLFFLLSIAIKLRGVDACK